MTNQSKSAKNPGQKALIERRSFPPRPALLTDLPFVVDVKIAPRKTARSFWHVPPTDDCGEANQIGTQYACDFVQYLKENPCLVGLGQLNWLVADMAKCADSSSEKGYAIGFFAFLEQLLYLAATHTDHYALAEKEAQVYAAIKAARETENAAAKAGKAGGK